MKLPIENVIADIKKTLSQNRYAVIQAPPGAGKTTLVPLALLDEHWLSGKKIIMLEPRRIATRASAGRMAALLNETVGATVGYHIRMDRCVGPDTRIEVITEGILTRRIQNDPSLDEVGLIIFDEFHERNLNSDLGLALAMESCEVFRDDLRLLVMSATIDSEQISELMGNAPVIRSDGKSWPVETRYVPVSQAESHPAQLAKVCAALIKRVIVEEDGDMLVFLPGAGEIKRVETILNDSLSDNSLSIMPLFGNLSKKDQDFAIAPSRAGHRKIVLATPIAETSITIDGVSIVIDSGLMRVPKYYSGTGMSRLETIPVSKSSADQRRGRAGRTKPGICYRLWDESRHGMLKAFNTPEIVNTDLTGFVLELATWGVSDTSELKLLDLPPDSALDRARQTLMGLGAMDSLGKITHHGKKMAGFGLHPRFAHMIIKGKEAGAGSLACFIAALLSERDFIFFKNTGSESDIALRLEIIQQVDAGRRFFDKKMTINNGIIKMIIKNASRFGKMIGVRHDLTTISKAGSLLALAYPERILQLRGGSGGYVMANGKGAFFSPEDSLAQVEYAVAAELDGKAGNSRVYLAASYSKEALMTEFGESLETITSVLWDKKSGAVIAKKETKYGALIIEKEIIKKPDPDLVAGEMIEGIKSLGLDCLPWTKKLRQFQARAVFLFKTGMYQTFPDISDVALINTPELWLQPYLMGISKASHLKKLDLPGVLLALFSWEQQQQIKTDAPATLTVPSGSVMPLKYPEAGSEQDESPVLAVRLQELFGLEETPYVAKGRVPVTIHLLSPASRPVQVTKDLKNFWKTTYRDVKKELMGRYPKHYWPDDPFTAIPTNKTKKKMNKQ